MIILKWLLRYVSFVALVIAITSATTNVTLAGQSIKNVILIHGAWANSASWSYVIPLLQAKGLNVVAVQLPLTSLADDTAAVKRAIANVNGPVLLVAHSYGGGVMTQAGDDPKVAGLVYLAASAPDIGQSFADLIKPYPLAPALTQATLRADGFFSLSAKGMVEDVAPDLPRATATILAVEQVPLAAKAFTDRLTHAAWRHKPTWYVIAADDRTVPVALERALAGRMHATTTTIQSSHMIIMSHPSAVAGVIDAALTTLR
jgi:pimeloyl-ACP methyl ester carboxylesterase